MKRRDILIIGISLLTIGIVTSATASLVLRANPSEAAVTYLEFRSFGGCMYDDLEKGPYEIWYRFGDSGTPFEDFTVEDPDGVMVYESSSASDRETLFVDDTFYVKAGSFDAPVSGRYEFCEEHSWGTVYVYVTPPLDVMLKGWVLVSGIIASVIGLIVLLMGRELLRLYRKYRRPVNPL